MLIYVLLFGAAGGCAFWVFAAYKILHKWNGKRKVISAAKFKAEAKKYEGDGATVAEKAKNLKGGKADV